MHYWVDWEPSLEPHRVTSQTAKGSTISETFPFVVLPFLLQSGNIVAPSCKLRSALATSSSLTTASCPFSAALCNVVCPSRSPCILTSALASSSSLTTSSCL